jgi:hypothetical protein
MSRRGPEPSGWDEPEFGHLEIPNRELYPDHVPTGRTDWTVIAHFALSFDGYRRWGSFERCAEIGNRWADMYMTAGEVPDTLDLCRTCLFFEQRRWRNLPSEPDPPTRRYVAALLDKITALVRRPGSDAPAGGAAAPSARSEPPTRRHRSRETKR